MDRWIARPPLVFTLLPTERVPSGYSAGAEMLQPRAASPWPKLRQRFGALVRDVYAETVVEGAVLISRALPADVPGVPRLHTSFANTLVRMLAIAVAAVGRVERALLGSRGIAVQEVREATASELQMKAGQLRGEGMLPSAYDVWLGARSEGRLRLRCAYDGPRVRALLEAAGAVDAHSRVCDPTPLDEETREWVRQRVARPAADSRLQVWRALKRRLYHYDAGVYAFHGFPRNYLLSPAQWAALLDGRPRGSAAAALDVGAGDGSLTAAFAPLFGSVLATEMTAPLVCRLRDEGFQAVVTDSIEHSAVQQAPPSQHPPRSTPLAARPRLLHACSGHAHNDRAYCGHAIALPAPPPMPPPPHPRPLLLHPGAVRRGLRTQRARPVQGPGAPAQAGARGLSSASP